MSLEIEVGKLVFKNPVLTASGTSGYGEEFNEIFDVNKLGGLVSKGLTLEEKQGNDGLRVDETPSGMINRIGLQNVGVGKFIKEKIPFLNTLSLPVIVNIAGFSIEEFVSIIEKLDKFSVVSGYEINVSCPNVKEGGIFFSADKKLFENLLTIIRKKTKKFITVKLSPSEGNMKEFLKISENSGCDAVTVNNTFKALKIDVYKKNIKIKGGLSGPAIYPIVLNNIYEAYNIVNIPIIASGGIYNTDVALQFLMAGASLIEIGSAGFVNPNIFTEVIDGLNSFVEQNGLNSIKEIIGAVHDK